MITAAKDNSTKERWQHLAAPENCWSLGGAAGGEWRDGYIKCPNKVTVTVKII